MNNPKISVIIPVFNVEKHLGKCIESLLLQTYKNLEIIIIDDGSSDNSPNICDEYAKKDSRIVCLHQENKGVSFARNKGIELATGEYFHFLDSDDYMDEDAYEFLVDKLSEYSVEAICFEYYVTYLDGTDLTHSVDQSHYGTRDTKGAIYEHLFGSSDFLCTKLLPKYAVNNFRLRADIYRDEDTIFAMEVLNKIKTVYFCPRPLLHYVQSEESACRGSFRANQLSAINAIPIMEKLLSDGYSEWMNSWRKKYMHLMTTLYRDMYMDEDSYNEEKKKVHETFLELWRKGGITEVKSNNERIKFYLFRIMPDIYCYISKKINKL